MVCHRVQPGTPAISYKLITTVSCILHLASCILYPASLYQVPGTRHLGPDTWYQIDTEGRIPSTEPEGQEAIRGCGRSHPFLG